MEITARVVYNPTNPPEEKTRGDKRNMPAFPNTQKSLYYLIALVIGALAGAVGAAFHLSLDAIFIHYKMLLAFLDGRGVSIAVAMVLSGTAAVLAAYLVRRFAPEAAGSGIQEVEGAVEGLRVVRWLRILPVKFFGGILALSSGLILGREGPTIHMGAAIAQGVSDRFDHLSVSEKRSLLAAGAAAGLAAAFNAPLAAIMFITEEMRRQFPFRWHTYMALILASISSAIVAETLAGKRPLIHIPAEGMPFSVFPLMLLIGVILGILGVVFNKSLLWMLDYMRNIPRAYWWSPALVLGGMSGLFLVIFPEATRGGEHFVLEMSAAQLGVIALILLCVMRFVGTILSYACGVPGGIFAPMLSIAVSVGLAVGGLSDDFIPMHDDLKTAVAIVAMGAFFAASVQAPIVGTILVLELTGAYLLLLPMLITCVSASITATALGGRPIYEMLLEQTLRLDKKKKAETADERK